MKVVAFERNLQGTGASRRLRNSGKTPGIVYGADKDVQLVELDHNALWHALKKEVFHSSILDLEVGGKSQQVLLRDVQYHPFKQMVLHVDFQRVDSKKKLHTKVPLHFMNQETNPAVKLSGAVISHVINELEIECLPGDLPEFIEVDLANIEAGQIDAREGHRAAEGRRARRSPRSGKPGHRFGDDPGRRGVGCIDAAAAGEGETPAA